jgi:hypothetical protein
MPTRKRRPRHPIPDALTPGLVNVILTGEDPDDAFLRFEVDLLEGGDYLPRLYRENKAALDAEFQRRGLTGKPWVLRP